MTELTPPSISDDGDAREFPFRHAETQLLADLTLARGSIRSASKLILPLCTSTFANLGAEETEMRWTAAVIGYCRVFHTWGGCVLRWDDAAMVEQLDQRDQATHRYIFDVRSGHLAHSIGGYEDATPYIKAKGTGGDWQVTAVGTRSPRIAGPGSAEADTFARLASHLDKLLTARIEAELDRLFDVAADLGEAYFAGAPEGPDVLRGKPKQARKRFDGRRAGRDDHGRGGR